MPGLGAGAARDPGDRRLGGFFVPAGSGPVHSNTCRHRAESHINAKVNRLACLFVPFFFFFLPFLSPMAHFHLFFLIYICPPLPFSVPYI